MEQILRDAIHSGKIQASDLERYRSEPITNAYIWASFCEHYYAGLILIDGSRKLEVTQSGTPCLKPGVSAPFRTHGGLDEDCSSNLQSEQANH